MEEFNGRWNLTLSNDPRGRAWWLKVEGAGTPQLKGTFVGAPGGQVDPIPQIVVHGNELVWAFERVYRRSEDDREKAKGVYRARIENGLLVGSHIVEGRPDKPVHFTGKRAPVLNEIDDGKWKKGKPVELFNGKDLTGWSTAVKSREINWRVENGVMKNGERAPDITSLARFWNFHLHMQYCVAQKSNSGIGLRGRYEVQIYGDHGAPLTGHGNGALYSRIVPALNATLPPDQWQTFDITLIGRQLTVVLNGKTLIDRQQVEGLTAMATDANEDKPGPTTLQGDHGPVEFRTITVAALKR